MSNDEYAAEAYAALVHVKAGHWDGYLLRLVAAMNDRLRSPEVRRQWVSGGALDEIPQAPHFTEADVDETG